MNKLLSRLGIDSEQLDPIVDEAASRMASFANNEGMSSQVTLLTQAGYSESHIIKAVLSKHLKVGTEVDVSEPRHSDSTHSYSFTGTIVAVLDDGLRVEDMEHNAFDIEYDELEKVTN